MSRWVVRAMAGSAPASEALAALSTLDMTVYGGMGTVVVETEAGAALAQALGDGYLVEPEITYVQAAGGGEEEPELADRLLLHVTPKFLGRGDERLEEIEFPRLGLRLLGGKDVATGNPYPNKRYSVGYRKRGRKALEGLMISIPRPEGELHYTARWNAGGIVVTHHVTLRLEDSTFDAVTDAMVLWNSFKDGDRLLPSRIPTLYGAAPPVQVEPRMERQPIACGPRLSDPRDRLGADGMVVERWESILVPTVERERFSSWLASPRFPREEDAFVVADLGSSVEE